MRYDAVIVGAGSSGNKAAEVLAKSGKKVLILERHAEVSYKVSAGGLTTNCMRLGQFPPAILERTFNTISLHTPLQSTTITQHKPFISTINMKKMHQFLAEKAIRAGAELRTNSLVTGIKKDRVIVNGKEEIKFKYLIGADGSNSFVRKFLNIPTENSLVAVQYMMPQRFERMEVFLDAWKWGPAYAWIFPYKKSTSLGTGADLSRAGKKFPPMGEVKKMFDAWCRKYGDMPKESFESSLINYDYQGHEFGNISLIGDAGGFSCGLTGEGIYPGLLSATDVAKKIIDPRYECEGIRHTLKIKRYQEKILRAAEMNTFCTAAIHEIFALLAKSQWFADKIIKYAD